MPHHEHRDYAWELRSYDLCEVGEHQGGRAGVPFIRGLLHAPTKAPLIVADGEDASLREAGEEVVVAADMVAEAVDEDDFGNGATFRLPSGSASVSS